MYYTYMNKSTANEAALKAQLSDEVDMIRAGEKVRRMQAADIFPDVAEIDMERYKAWFKR